MLLRELSHRASLCLSPPFSRRQAVSVKASSMNTLPTTTITGALLLLCAGLCQGQTTAAATSDYSIVQRGPDSRVWQRSLARTNAVGTVTTNLQSYTEIATGVCYLSNGSNGQYLDSVTCTNYGGTNWSPYEPSFGLAEGFILVSATYHTWIQRCNPCGGD